VSDKNDRSEQPAGSDKQRDAAESPDRPQADTEWRGNVEVSANGDIVIAYESGTATVHHVDGTKSSIKPG